MAELIKGDQIRRSSRVVGSKLKQQEMEEILTKVRNKIQTGICVKYVSKHVGNGVFADRSFQPKEYICVYDGDLTRTHLTSHEYGRHSQDSNFRNNYQLFFKFQEINYIIDGTDCLENFGRTINHALDGNVKPNVIYDDKAGIPKVYFTATKEIKLGEQIFWNYGETNPEVIQDNPWLRNKISDNLAEETIPGTPSQSDKDSESQVHETRMDDSGIGNETTMDTTIGSRDERKRSGSSDMFAEYDNGQFAQKFSDDDDDSQSQKNNVPNLTGREEEGSIPEIQERFGLSWAALADHTYSQSSHSTETPPAQHAQSSGGQERARVFPGVHFQVMKETAYGKKRTPTLGGRVTRSGKVRVRPIVGANPRKNKSCGYKRSDTSIFTRKSYLKSADSSAGGEGAFVRSIKITPGQMRQLQYGEFRVHLTRLPAEVDSEILTGDVPPISATADIEMVDAAGAALAFREAAGDILPTAEGVVPLPHQVVDVVHDLAERLSKSNMQMLACDAPPHPAPEDVEMVDATGAALASREAAGDILPTAEGVVPLPHQVVDVVHDLAESMSKSNMQLLACDAPPHPAPEDVEMVDAAGAVPPPVEAAEDILPASEGNEVIIGANQEQGVEEEDLANLNQGEGAQLPQYRPYTPEEDATLIRNVLGNHVCKFAKGNAIWKKFAELEICPGRGYASMRNRFRRTLVDRVLNDDIEVSLENQRTIQVFKNSSGLVRPTSQIIASIRNIPLN